MKYSFFTLNLVQGASSCIVTASAWMLKQVQHDGLGRSDHA